MDSMGYKVSQVSQLIPRVDVGGLFAISEHHNGKVFGHHYLLAWYHHGLTSKPNKKQTILRMHIFFRQGFQASTFLGL